VTLVTTDLDVASWNAWVTLVAQRRTATESRVDAEVLSSAVVSVTTRNAAVIALRLAPFLGLDGSVTVRVDGDDAAAIDVSPDEAPRVLLARQHDGAWRRLSPGQAARVQHVPGTRPGSYAKATFSPFVIVTGTADSRRSEALLACARSLATAWWVRGNGTAPIVRDADVTDALRAGHELVLVGGPDVNLESRRLSPGLALVASRGGVRVGDRLVRGSDLVSAHWQPAPGGASRVLVLQSTSAEADTLLPWLNPFAPGAGWPDWVVATPRVRSSGWAGLAGAGFFEPDWRVGDDSWLASGR
jgi:hypothetical protein